MGIDQVDRPLRRGAGSSRGRLRFLVSWNIGLVSERFIIERLGVRLDLHH
jgi:hypothetical protein